jgi:DNA processing protein
MTTGERGAEAVHRLPTCDRKGGGCVPIPKVGVEEAEWCLRWLGCRGIGAASVRRLVSRFGSLREAAGASADEVAETLGMERLPAEQLLRRIGCGGGDPEHADAGSPLGPTGSSEDVRDRGAPSEAEARARGARRELERISALGARPVVFGDAAYPALLAASADPPAFLIVRGALDGAADPAVAIVGSRLASAYGRVTAGRFAAELAERGVTVVSGGARGIDAEAHRGALRAGGRTVAVVATGFDRPYPPEHRDLFEEIVAAGGAVVGEQPCGTEARPELFPKRNRIVAGLSVVTVVIEAAARSGALLTARLAVEDDGREAACVPGRIDQPQSEGCHRAIREGWAHLATSVDDILEILDGARTLPLGAAELAARRGAGDGRPGRRREVASAGQDPPSAAAGRAARALGADAAHLVRFLATGPAGMDALEDGLAWPVPRIASALLEAELAGRVCRAPDGGYACR